MVEYTKGLVSVIMPTYKRSAKLVRAIESVLTQSYANLELLVVNDNEPDDKFTKELVRKVECFSSDPRFKLIMQEKHINGAVARNVGIRQAKGEYIAFLDDDDWWKCNKIERQVDVLESLDESWGGVSCRIEQYNGDKIIAALPKYNDGYVYKDILMLKCDLATSTLLLRHRDLDIAGYFDENLLRHQDYQLLADFTFRFKLKQLDELLHCCDVSDTVNRPDGNKLILHKKRFFESVAPVMAQLSRKERRCIYAVHNFEIGYVYAKNNQYFKAIKYVCMFFCSWEAVAIVFYKIKQKIVSQSRT